MKNFGFVKCAIANFNGNLADPGNNFYDICNIMEQAEEKDVKVLVLPELCLTGYCCQDLFETSELLEKSLTTLYHLLKKSGTPDFNAVTLVGLPLKINDSLYNCAVVIHKGEILGVVPKQYVPNYNEFYEKRWFTPYNPIAEKNTTIKIFDKEVPFGNIIFVSSLGYKLGVEICEDLWAVIPPSSYLALGGANIIANLSASNELVGKDDYRRDLVKSQSARTISAYLYASSGFSESTSDLVFGGSGYAYENGKELASMERFSTEDQLVTFYVDVDYLSNERIKVNTFSDSKRNLKDVNITYVDFIQEIPPFEDLMYSYSYSALERKVNPHPFIPNIVDEAGGKVCKEILSIQSTALARRLSSIGCKKVTLGVSGGLDSTLALLVCYEAFKKLDLDTTGILGITMPGFGTTNRTYNNSLKLCEALGTTLKEVSIKDACMQHFKDIEHDPAVHDITYENVQARYRTSILMNSANKNSAILVGTGDLSELMLGWCTYNGDHMSMYNVNCSIPKTLVKYLIEWYAKFYTDNEELKNTLLDIIDTPISPELLPSDGKTVVQKTESSVGPYELIDFFIYNLLRNRFSGEKNIFLAEMAFAGKYSSEEIEKYYNDFIKRVFNNQFKRNCVPDGPKVGSVSVSPRGDLRMPSDASFISWRASSMQ